MSQKARPVPFTSSMPVEEDSVVSLHTLRAPGGSVKKRKRLGRGESSGLGKTSGKGNKGFSARSGGGVKPGYEGGQMPIQRRLPKKGFRPHLTVRYQEVNIRDLERCSQIVEYNPDVMLDCGLIRRSDRPIKVLGKGSLERKILVKAHAFSDSAKRKITGTGGSVEVI